MKSLVLLCHDGRIPKRQKEFFCTELIALLSADLSSLEIAARALSELWVRYDSGGMSLGRTLRAALLEEMLPQVRDGDVSERTKLLLSVLLSMYHDCTFINAQHWYDYHIEHFHESDVFHRVWLSTAAFALNIDEVVDMADWPLEKIKELLSQES